MYACIIPQAWNSIFCVYEGCLESIQPFWISWEPVPWPWCNLAASQRRPYCASVNSRSPVGLVSRQWDAVDWACVLCNRHIHNDGANRSTSSWYCVCPFLPLLSYNIKYMKAGTKCNACDSHFFFDWNSVKVWKLAEFENVCSSDTLTAKLCESTL